MRDSASLPEEISGVWQIWNQADKRWMPSEGLKVTAVGNIQVSITGSMPPSCSLHGDKLGDFVRLKGQESSKHTVYKKKEGETMLWHAGGAWWIGPLTSLGKQAGYWNIQRCWDGTYQPWLDSYSRWEG